MAIHTIQKKNGKKEKKQKMFSLLNEFLLLNSISQSNSFWFSLSFHFFAEDSVEQEKLLSAFLYKF